MKHGNMRRFLPLLAAITLLVGLFAAGCTSANKEVVATCGGDPVLREEYSFLAGKLADEGLGEEEIREKIAPSIIEDRAILAAGADLLDGLTVDDKSVKAAVKAGVKEAIAAYGGKDAYRAALAEQSLTEHHLKRMLAVAEIQRLVTEKLFAGTELENATSFAEWLTDDAHYARVERYDFRSEAEAEAFLAAAAGGDADALYATCGGVKASASYCFLGLGGEELDKLLFALPADNTTLSGVISERGMYSVYRRLSVSAEEREDMAALQGLAVRDELRSRRLDSLLAGYEEKLTVEWK